MYKLIYGIVISVDGHDKPALQFSKHDTAPEAEAEAQRLMAVKPKPFDEIGYLIVHGEIVSG